MMRVLGTTVVETGGDDTVAILVSDLHVPAGGGAVVASLRGALAAARARKANVYVLGDLFDTYVARGQVRTGVWREVAEIFATATGEGVRIQMLHGNRDFLLGPEFAEASGARVVAGGLRGRLAGVETLLLHGDELCQDDLPYQRAKRWLRHPLTRWVARRLPLRVALAVAERARQKSRKVIASGDQRRFLPTAAAVAAAFGLPGVKRLCFGHIHRHAHGLVAGGDYWVLPAFDETAIGLLCQDGQVLSVRFPDASGTVEVLTAPGPCPFSA